MILLRHLRVTAFKHLRDIDLWLPRRGSVLIEGHNESGKSTLFEAIYFVLYGKALVGEDQGNPPLEALMPHGETHAVVHLAIAAGQTELQITRTLTRNAKGLKHDAEARIHRPGKPVEVISAIGAVNDCILREMNGLDSAVLRNSCLMEQQALDRIETLSASDREMAVAKLLGIDVLPRIEQKLKVVRRDELLLDQARIKLHVAHQQHAAQDAHDETMRMIAAHQAARARGAVLARDAVMAQLHETAATLNDLTRETAHLHDRSQQAASLEGLLRRSDENTWLL
ncbi:MAG TPA: AAA family ATPase, partial [Ktedonobacterales bacterium]|nr:AAA family ATPase [Ktedonobacterales bacterium]